MLHRQIKGYCHRYKSFVTQLTFGCVTGICIKAGTEWKTELQMEWLNFVDTLYFTIVDLFSRYKGDNGKNITYINCLR